jgi:hypothetical protein
MTGKAALKLGGGVSTKILGFLKLSAFINNLLMAEDG